MWFFKVMPGVIGFGMIANAMRIGMPTTHPWIFIACVVIGALAMWATADLLLNPEDED